MLEDIELKRFPKESGVYKIIWNGCVIYVGSSKSLYQRMADHRSCIKQGSVRGYKKGFYLFLQKSPFSIEFELTENYKQREQELIDYYEPIFNNYKAFTGLTVKEYHKQHSKQYQKQYDNQRCNYNGEILTLTALKKRFQRKGISHATQEAKKYLI